MKVFLLLLAVNLTGCVQRCPDVVIYQQAPPVQKEESLEKDTDFCVDANGNYIVCNPNTGGGI